MAARRLLIKVSGEALGGAAGFGIDPAVLDRIAAAVVAVRAAGAQVALVLGGGNLCRGAELAAAGVDRITGDHMGMLATVMNALALRDALRAKGATAEVFAAHAIATVAEGYTVDKARGLMAAGGIALLAGGTGNPLFTTDTAACLRGIEIGADLVVKATKVDGVYSADPMTDPAATRFDTLTYAEAIDKRLGVMDLTALALCREHAMPVVVCDMAEPGALTKAARGVKVGTWISEEARRWPTS